MLKFRLFFAAFIPSILLSACSENAATDIMAPELSCLDRADSSIKTVIRPTEPSPANAKTYARNLISAIDSVDQRGCSASAIANLAQAKNSLATFLSIVDKIGVFGATTSQLAEMQAANDTGIGALRALDTERNQRRKTYDARFEK